MREKYFPYTSPPGKTTPFYSTLEKRKAPDVFGGQEIPY
jgi:hypothetical protein